MTRFVDGPAAGKSMALQRQPLFLRVTEANGKFDALDQLDDEPRLDETLIAYRKTDAEPLNCHIRFGGNQKHKSGFYRIQSYALCETQPEDATMRHSAKWREWCRLQVEAAAAETQASKA